jgi:hypothetical protein
MKRLFLAVLFVFAAPAWSQVVTPMPVQNPLEILAQGVTALVVGPPMVAVALGWAPETIVTTFSTPSQTPTQTRRGIEGRYQFFCERILLGKWTQAGPGSDSCPGGNWLNVYRFTVAPAPT